jgi:hypothetical protein
VLNEEHNPTRRASAVLLVGHFTDPKEIINTLLPYINDEDSTVRNNSMRVIATTLVKAKRLTLDVRPFLELLNSPYLTDRNKALFILYNLSISARVRAACIKSAVRLVALLALKQPNQHDTAYLLLKQISGQDFGEHNVPAWRQWARLQQLSS